jgi:hypothetical protein
VGQGNIPVLSLDSVGFFIMSFGVFVFVSLIHFSPNLLHKIDHAAAATSGTCPFPIALVRSTLSATPLRLLYTRGMGRFLVLLGKIGNVKTNGSDW